MTGWWEWPIAESLHFIGLSMLIGTVGVFDLRLMGLGKQIPSLGPAPADSRGESAVSS